MPRSLFQFISKDETIGLDVPPTHKDEPQLELFNAVIMQALLDISKESRYPDEHREEAMAWFFSSVVSAIANFEEVCDLAGVQATKVRSCAIRILESTDKESIRKQINYYLHNRN
jgi:hypothetical protein|tara:strand:+ start:67 stop:411 length:345 start_codon:yes stop_codon:yes gene_type:complete